jgi:hypothetical protein
MYVSYKYYPYAVVIKFTDLPFYNLHNSFVNGDTSMVANVHQFTDTNSTVQAITEADLKRIARSLQRAELSRRYSHGTIKRRAMAMINHYIRAAAKNLAHRPADMHPAM